MKSDSWNSMRRKVCMCETQDGYPLCQVQVVLMPRPETFSHERLRLLRFPSRMMVQRKFNLLYVAMSLQTNHKWQAPTLDVVGIFIRFGTQSGTYH